MSDIQTTTMVKLSINNQAIEADIEETILDVCRRTGIADIPTLCYSPTLPAYGSCFVCVVEVEGARSLQPACATKVRDGMVIQTDSERVHKSRKMALELLLSAHWADCQGPCQVGCPAGVDAQGYLALAREGKFNEAVELIKRVNPLPIVCGRVCIRACEVVCERQHVEDPVGINFVKRYAAELERGEVFLPEPKEPTGKRVAVVGAGPAGLTCAYYLGLEGVNSVLLDMWPQPGGMLRYGIPEYRLPKALLDQEISTITRLGAEIRNNEMLGRDFTLESLRDEYDAVFVAVGAPVGKGMRLEGEDTTEGVLSGLDFLTRVEMGNPLHVKGRVVVIGGGNTAVDASRTAFRLGAEEVIILYRRTRTEMPADAVEIHAAEEEGVDIQFLAAPTKIVEENGRLTGIEALRMELGEPDSSGRRRPVPMPGSEFTMQCDYLFGAIGQGTDLAWADEDDAAANALERTKWSTIVTDERTMETAVPGVFAGGDVVTGPTVVIDAIAAGKRAATGILSYLQTGTASAPELPFYSIKKLLAEPTPDLYEHLEKKDRSQMPEPDPQVRKRLWDEAELGLEQDAVLYETDRCLVCGCLDLGDCDLQKLATQYGADPSRLVGSVVKHKPDHSHPFVVLDNNKCILCGKCVSICRDLVGPAALGFVSRGFETAIRPTLEMPLAESPCIGCGNCIDACPTGALMDHLRYRKLREWKIAYTPTICTHCGLGCDMTFASIGPGLFWIQTPKGTPEPGYGQLCVRGRFGHRYIEHDDRIKTPLVRKNGELCEASWDEAIDRAVEILGNSDKKRDTAVFGSGSLTMEEAYLLQKIGRSVLKTPFVGGSSQLSGVSDDIALDSLIGFTGSTVPAAAIDDAGLVIVLNTELGESAPVLGFRVHRALERGAELLVIGKTEDIDTFGRGTRIESPLPASVMGALLRRLAFGGALDRDFLRRRCSGADRLEYALKNAQDRELLADTGVSVETIDLAADTIRNADGPVVAIARATAANGEDLRALAVLLLSLGRLGSPGSGLILVRDQVNDQGLVFAGLHPAFLPGRKDSDKCSTAAMAKALTDGSVGAAIVVADDPLSHDVGADLLKNVGHLVVLDTFLSETGRSAEVVLPISAPGETSGRFVNFERRIRRAEKVTDSSGGRETWAVLSTLKARLENAENASSFSEIESELEEAGCFTYLLNADDTGIPRELFVERFATESGTAPLERPTSEESEKGESARNDFGTLRKWVTEFMKHSGEKCCEL